MGWFRTKPNLTDAILDDLAAWVVLLERQATADSSNDTSAEIRQLFQDILARYLVRAAGYDPLDLDTAEYDKVFEREA